MSYKIGQTRKPNLKAPTMDEELKLILAELYPTIDDFLEFFNDDLFDELDKKLENFTTNEKQFIGLPGAITTEFGLIKSCKILFNRLGRVDKVDSQII